MKRFRSGLNARLGTLAVLALCAALAAPLASCRAPRPKASLAHDVQYYDAPRGNIIEIPTFLGEETPGLLDIRRELDALKAQFARYQEDPFDGGGWAEVAAFPTTTDRYLNLAIVARCLASSGSDGDLYSWVYDREEERRVTLEEALDMAAPDEGSVEAALENYYADGDDPIALEEWEWAGFRIKADGGVDFYLYASNAYTDLEGGGWLEPWRGIFTWTADGELIRMGLMDPILIPGDQVDDLGAPLWCQWPGGEVPEELVTVREFPVKPTALHLRNDVYAADWGAGRGHFQNTETYRGYIFDRLLLALNVIQSSTGVPSGAGEAVYTDGDGVDWLPFFMYESLRGLREDCERYFTPEAARRYCPWAYEGDVLMEHDGRLYRRADFRVEELNFPDRSYYCMDALACHDYEENRLTFTLPNADSNTLDRFVLVWDEGRGDWRFDEYGAQVGSLKDSLLGELWRHAWEYADREVVRDPGYNGMVLGVHPASLVQYPTYHHPDGVDYKVFLAGVDVKLSNPEFRGQPLEDYLYRDGDPEPWLIFAVRDGRQYYLGSLPRDVGEPDGEAFRAVMEARWAARRESGEPGYRTLYWGHPFGRRKAPARSCAQRQGGGIGDESGRDGFNDLR